jgi:hypothetical protein
MRLTDITSLGRTPIDPSYPTNLAIGGLTLAVTIAGAILRLVSGAAPLESVQWGIEVGLVLFLAWALGRELDPDHDLAAFVGVGLVLVTMLFANPPSLLLVLWLLLVLRTVNRTVGLPAKLVDSLAVLSLGVWLTLQGIWLAGLVTAIAFLLDGLLMPPLRRHLVASGLSFIIMVVLAVWHGGLAPEGATRPLVVIASVTISCLFLIVIATTRESRAVGDATGKPLNPRRVQAAQVLALLTALMTSWWNGAPGVEALLPLWAAMLGISLYRIASLLLSRSRQS